MRNIVKLKIADLIIVMKSRFPIIEYSLKDWGAASRRRYNVFRYRGNRKPDIIIDVEVVDRLPAFAGGRAAFVAYGMVDRLENWRISKRKDNYIYRSCLPGRKQLILINEDFDRIRAYLPAKGKNIPGWSSLDLAFDFLQILTLNYLSHHKKGMILHAAGLKNARREGFIFSGRSGAGKSTLAQLWNRYAKKGGVLNDDRVIVRRQKGKFFIYPCPWHGEFSDHELAPNTAVKLKKLFFIYHAPKNIIGKIERRQAFDLLYPVVFSSFWKRQNQENLFFLCQELINNVPCYRLGFLKNKQVVSLLNKH